MPLFHNELPSRRMRNLPGRGLMLGCALSAWFCMSEAHALNFTVNDYEDWPDREPGDGYCEDERGLCTLRAAIEETNALPRTDWIGVPEGYYGLTEGQLTITDGLIVAGLGDPPVIDAQGNSRVLAICENGRPKACRGGEPGPSGIFVHIANLRITRGKVGDNWEGGFVGGGGIAIGRGTSVTLLSVEVRDNEAAWSGGGILNHGRLTVERSTISHNWASGDGPYPLIGAGGGIAVLSVDESTSFEESLIAYNAARNGGGIASFGSLVRIRNTTVSGNYASVVGGGMEASHNARTDINFATITQNRVGEYFDEGYPLLYGGGGIYNDGTLVMGNSILADNSDRHDPFDQPVDADRSPDCKNPPHKGVLWTAGNNIIGNGDHCVRKGMGRNDDESDPAISAGHDEVGNTSRPVDPRLRPLADNGGPTPTHALRQDSPAKDLVKFDTRIFELFFHPQSRDQRGFERPEPYIAPDLLDAGAFEEGATR